MARPALVLTAALVLGFGVTSGHHPARCHGLYGVARVCDASATTPAQARAKRFAGALLTRWNGVIGRHGYPADLAACAPYGRPDGEAVFSCEWRMRDLRNRKWLCRLAVLSTSFTEFNAAWVPCRGPFRPPQQTAPPA